MLKDELALLPKAHRLASGREIARVYRKGRSARSDLFRISWLMTSRPSARVSVVTSRKLSTKAVRRNLLKRQVRGLVQRWLSTLVPADLVIEVLPTVISQASAKRRDAARATVGESLAFSKLETDLRDLLVRSRLLPGA